MYPKIENFEKQIQLKSKEKIDRQLLVEKIKSQYKNIKLFKPLKQNIKLLKDENCYTITTGHQLNLFLGPPYMAYKILSTISMCNRLSESYKNYKFVPIYWLASEDDDFEEINNFYIDREKFEWKTKQKTKKSGKIELASLEPLIKLLEDKVTKNNVFDIFQTAYTKNKTLSQAHREILNELFGKYGLICIDGDDKHLKKKIIPFLKDEIEKNSSFRTINETNEKIKTKYKSIQANPSKINMFYVDGEARKKINLNSEGEENRILISKKNLLKTICDNPEKLSPNVVLRPLYQEVVLPNLCYIGGANELSYWLELKKMFKYHKVTFPIIKLRKFIFIIKQKHLKTIIKNKITNKELFTQTNKLIKEKITQNKLNLDYFDEYKIKLEEIFSSLKDKAEQEDKSLIANIKAERIKILSRINHIRDKLIKSKLNKYKTTSKQIENLKQNLFPQGIAQDRFYNFFEYLNNEPNLIDILYKDMDIFKDELEFRIIN